MLFLSPPLVESYMNIIGIRNEKNNRPQYRPHIANSRRAALKIEKIAGFIDKNNMT